MVGDSKKTDDPAEGGRVRLAWGPEQEESCIRLCGAQDVRRMKFRALVMACRVKSELGYNTWANGLGGGGWWPSPKYGSTFSDVYNDKKMAN